MKRGKWLKWEQENKLDLGEEKRRRHDMHHAICYFVLRPELSLYQFQERRREVFLLNQTYRSFPCLSISYPCPNNPESRQSKYLRDTNKEDIRKFRWLLIDSLSLCSKQHKSTLRWENLLKHLSSTLFSVCIMSYFLASHSLSNNDDDVNNKTTISSLTDGGKRLT